MAGIVFSFILLSHYNRLYIANKYRRQGASLTHQWEYVRHTRPSAAYIFPFRTTAVTIPITNSGAVSSVCRKLPSPCSISRSPLRAMMRCSTILPPVSLASTVTPGCKSSGTKPPSVTRSRRSARKGPILFPRTGIVTECPPLISLATSGSRISLSNFFFSICHLSKKGHPIIRGDQQTKQTKLFSFRQSIPASLSLEYDSSHDDIEVIFQLRSES